MQPIIQTSKRTQIIEDLYRIMYIVPMTADPDNWDLTESLAKAIINHHALPYAEKDEVPDSIFWGDEIDVMDKFFLTTCPGSVPTFTAFEYLCSIFFDWNLWEQIQAVGNVFPAIDKAVIALKLTPIATVEAKDNIILVTPIENKIAS